MSVDTDTFEGEIRRAVRSFWQSREHGRASVTAGKNMDGFAAFLKTVVTKSGLTQAKVHEARAVLTLPGFFRPTKLWDLLITCGGELVAAIELKSQVGPSFGNNFNNCAEEAIGSAHDFWTAYRAGAFGKQPPPFVGWLMLVEDTEKSRLPVKDAAPHFPVLPEFENASYLKRYDLLCQKLIQEKLYTAAAVLASSPEAKVTGAYESLSEMTGARAFVASLLGHCLTVANRRAE